jgi:hypothetical protein
MFGKPLLKHNLIQSVLNLGSLIEIDEVRNA